MSNLIPGNNKHLTLEDRKYIEKSLNECILIFVSSSLGKWHDFYLSFF